MPRGCELSDEERGKIEGMRHAGMRICDIAAATNLDESLP
ncbi:hypothetical protein FF38_14258 [Lucilia cuprina]|uniref:Tc3 transposase DNA binding domain-containing protein n=1 Tax=Lucilia cuprina TaxID=7375 RepID=A0A0L0CNQ6_LUCCU|nr:hypothetical protein FF38_14258 [Lucilia cuprina]